MNSFRSPIALLLGTFLLVVVCRGSAGNAPRSPDRPAPVIASKPSALPPGVIPLTHFTGVRDAVEKRHLEIRKILEQKISGEFSKLTVSEAMQRLSQKGKLFPVRFDEETEPDRKLPDDLRFKNVPRRDVLRRILDQTEMRWTLANESLQIIVSHGEEERSLKVYPVADFAFPKASRRARQTGLGFGSLEVPGTQKPTDFDWLRNLLQSETSGPWQPADGIGGTATLLNGSIRVWQTKQTHAEIDGILAGLRLAAQGKLNGNVLFLREAGYPAAADARAVKRSSRRISLVFRDIPLPDALKLFSDATGIPMRSDRKVLKNEGLGAEPKVSLNARNAVASSALQRMLDPLLTFVLDRGEFVITSKTDAEERLTSAIYDIRDLMAAKISGDQILQTIERETSGPWVNGEGIGGSMILIDELGSLFVRQSWRNHKEIAEVLQSLRKPVKAPPSKSSALSKPRNPADIQTRIYLADDAEQAKSLENVIPVFVAAGTWQVENSNAAIRVVDDKLIVRQTVKVHGEIRKFLDELDAADQTDRLSP